MRTLEKKDIIFLLSALVAFVAVVYLSADAISLTMPPWNYCGFHETHIGTALDCIRFDTEPFTLK